MGYSDMQPLVQAAGGMGCASDHDAAVTTWVKRLVRTLKSCRLYDSGNPMVIKSREDLAYDLASLLEREGKLTLRFSSDDVFYGEISTYPAQSSGDNLAGQFHRDGIRSITFHSGIELDEVETFLDQVLRVSGPQSSDEDLVTLLWDADIPHLSVDCAPIASELDAGAVQGADTTGPAAPWPKPDTEPDEASSENQEPGRSDDWKISGETGDLELSYAHLERMAPKELERFLAEFGMEREESVVRSALTLIGDCLAIRASREVRVDLGRYLQRILHEAIRTAAWEEAHECLVMLRSCEVPDWSARSLAEELLCEFAVVTPECVDLLDKQPTEEVEFFLVFVKELGPEATEWLMTVLAQSQRKSVRRPLTRVIADHCRMHPERLRSWLTNPEWYVVRNVVHICGWIGGNSVVKLLRCVINHPEPKVRQEVVATLGQVDPAAGRSILFSMIEKAQGSLLIAILHQLSQDPNPVISAWLLRYMVNPRFADRTLGERRAVYSALVSCAGDDLAVTLGSELHKWVGFSFSADTRRRSLASCLALINSDKSRAVLRRGAQSWHPAVRQACVAALSGVEKDD